MSNYIPPPQGHSNPFPPPPGGPFLPQILHTEPVQSVQSTCCKCGSTTNTVAYHKTNETVVTSGCDYYSHNKRSGEHLHYKCSNCGYDWVEDTLDNKSKKET